jgi:hypothetical protein
MVYKGHIKNGQVVIESTGPLPEGAELRIEVVPAKVSDAASDAEWLLSFAGCLDHLPPAASRNVDHYLYGTPKKK